MQANAAGLTALVQVPGGLFAMGSTQFYPDEGPVHEERVAPLAIERHLVTNAQFATFVGDTGYVTVAEQPLDPASYPGVAEEDLRPGALVFRATHGPVDLADWRQWWTWAPGANWRNPFGPDSDLGALPTTRWCRSATPTPWPTRPGPVADCPPRANGSTRPGRLDGQLRLGRGGAPGRPADGQHLAGPVPVRERRCSRLGRHVAGRQLPGEPLRPAG